MKDKHNNLLNDLLEEKFQEHIGHDLTLTRYINGDIVLECLTCQEAIITVSDFENYEYICKEE